MGECFKSEIKDMIDKFENAKTLEMLLFLIRRVLEKESKAI